MKEEEKTLIIKPFYGSNFKVKVNIPKKKKGSKLKPFPHNMQFNNMHLLQENNYHLFNGDAAIYLKDAEYIKFDHLLYDLPVSKNGKKLKDFFNNGTYMKTVGYKIMLCNPHYTEKQLFDCLYNIFVHFVHIPKTKNLIQYVKKLGNNKSFIEGNIRFTKENIKRIEIAASQVYNKPFKGKIKKQPKIIYNPDYDLSTQEKRKLANELQGNKKSNNTLEQIYTALLNWNKEEGKVTQKKIAAKLGVSKRTIQTYWKTAKQELSTTI